MAWPKHVLHVLQVTEALRKELNPRRSLEGSAKPFARASATRTMARIQKAYTEKKHFWPKTSHAAIFERGLTDGDEKKLDELRRAVHALLLEPSVEAIVAASIDTLAGAEQVMSRVDNDVDWFGIVAALRGVPFAVEVAHRSADFGLTAGSGGWTTAVWIASVANVRDRQRATRWLGLRHALCAATEPDYAAARAIAKKARAGAELGLRATIAYAFPDEPWANEDLAAANARPHEKHERSYGFLLAAATDIEEIKKTIEREGTYCLAAHAMDLVHVLAPADFVTLAAEGLPKTLVKPKYGPLLKTPPRQIAQALACYRTKEAAAVLGPYASNAVLAPVVLAYFRDAPELAGAAGGNGKAAAAVGKVAERGAKAAKASKSDAKAVRGKLAAKTPAVLRDRPWRAKASSLPAVDPKSIAKVLGEDEASVVIPDDAPAWQPESPIRDMTKAEVATWRKRVESKKYSHADYEHERRPGPANVWEYRRVPDKERVWAFNEHEAGVAGSYVELIAKDGLAVLPGFLKIDHLRWLAGSDDLSALQGLFCLRSPRVAPMVARIAARRKKQRRLAATWLLQNARIAALGLIPAAFGSEDGEAREDAEAALVLLAARGKESDVRAAAKRYGKDALRAALALLARDPLAIGATAGKRPDFLRIADLPTPFDSVGTEALVELLQIAPLDPPYSGIALVREAADEEALGALALDLVEQWVLGDAPGRHEWMLFAAVHFPSERATRRIAQLAREWARKDRAKAARACVALSAIGSDLALLHLAQIRDKTRYDALRAETTSLLAEAADARGLTPDELGDRTVPDVGLDAGGTLRLSYGERSMHVTLDETLRPVVEEIAADGTRTPSGHSLPRPRKTDDAAAVKAARERFDTLRDDLEAVADRERRRLERAMTTGRTWTEAAFRSCLLEHPLMVHVTRRLVWVALAPKTRAEHTFRVAEDGTFADENDDAFALPKGSEIRIAHPVTDPSLAGPWARIFGDYAILQPFEQLVRASFAIEAKEKTAKELARLAGITAPARKILGVLESRGFRRDNPGYVTGFVRSARTTDGKKVMAHVPLSPGFEIASLANCTDPTTEAPTLSGSTKFGALEALDFSELVRDVSALRGL